MSQARCARLAVAVGDRRGNEGSEVGGATQARQGVLPAGAAEGQHRSLGGAPLTPLAVGHAVALHPPVCSHVGRQFLVLHLQSASREGSMWAPARQLRDDQKKKSQVPFGKRSKGTKSRGGAPNYPHSSGVSFIKL